MGSRSDTMEIISPNNVLANAMLRTIDMVRPRLQATSPDRVAFCVGTQINGAPHLGTSLVQTAAFETYSAQQATPAFRHEFLATLGHLDQIRWPLAPTQLPGLSPPPRVYTPMVLTDTGAKLSKSLIREGKVTTAELDRIMTTRPATTTGIRAREMNLYRRYFDLVANGTKTIEVRVQYPNLRSLKAGDYIRFICGRDDALTKVKRVARYASFEEMLDTEGAEKVNPTSPRSQQLANIRRIYGPEKEALGVLAIEIELVAKPTS